MASDGHAFLFGEYAYAVKPSRSSCLIDPGPAAANAPWQLRFDRYELLAPCFPANRISGNLALMLLAVSFDPMLSKREDVEDIVITAVDP